MSVSIVDGIVESADLNRSARGLTFYRSLRFRLNDGSTRTMNRAVAKDAVAAHLQPGSAGRFYLFTGFDLKGVHGVRRPDGTAVVEFPNSNTKLFGVIVLINLVWMLFSIFVNGRLPFLAIGLLILGVVGYLLLSKTEKEARAQFENDRAVPAPPAEAAIQPGE